MEEFVWTDEQKQLAKGAVMERSSLNMVSRLFVPEVSMDWTQTTVPWNRYDFQRQMVDDCQTLGMFEPYRFVKLSRVQVDEGDLQRALSTLNRGASPLARWHDALVFSGYDLEVNPKPPGIEMPTCEPRPIGMRQAAMQAEDEERSEPISVSSQAIGESLVAAVNVAVMALEARGYYRDYHLVLGQMLWEAFNQPNVGALVRPRDVIEPSLLGGGSYKTTTIPEDEALLVSLDGPTLDCVVAGTSDEQPRLEFLRTQADDRGEEIYLLRLRERFAPRIRENRAIVRLKISV